MWQALYLFHFDSTEFTTNLFQTFPLQYLNPHMLLVVNFPEKIVADDIGILLEIHYAILHQQCPSFVQVFLLCDIILREIDPITNSV